MKVTVDSYRGEAPRVSPRLLPANAAQAAVNARLQTGDLEAWRQFATVKALANYPGPIETIYRLNGAWLSWASAVDVARGVIAGDTTFRTYLTGPDEYTEPRFTTYSLATTGSEPYPVTTRPLGVPGPDSAPTITVGVDPTPTTFSINILDEGDVLSTSWTTSPQVNSGGRRSEVGQTADGYALTWENNSGDAAWLYRNFGIAGAAAVRFSCDFMFTSGDDSHQQMLAHVMVPDTGRGLTVGYASDSADLAIILGAGWTSRSGSTVAATAIGALAYDVWHTLQVDVLANADGTQTVTASVYTGSAQIGSSVTATNSFNIGDYCGFVNEGTNVDSIDEFRTIYNNILVQASGSTNYTPVSTATSYVYTFVNDLGQESAPSPVSSTILRPDGVSVTVATPTAVPSGISAEYGVATKRIYRAAIGATGAAFVFVAEIDLATADYVDTLTDSDLGDPLESKDWDLPPSDLEGILALPNGVMAGFRKNQLCLSAQNHGHAWPVVYRLTVDTDIVAIGNIDTTVVIATQNFIYLAVGNDPANYAMSKLEIPQACVSKRSLAYLVGVGVVFASPDGLIAVAGNGQVRNITSSIFTRRQWQALNPETIRAIAHDDVYYFFPDGATGYSLDLKPDGVGLTTLSFHATAMFADPLTDKLYLVLDDIDEPSSPYLPVASTAPTPDARTIYEFDSEDGNGFLVYRWKGKLNLLPRPAAFLYCQVKASDYDNLLLRVYGDGDQIAEYVVTSDEPFMLPVLNEYDSAEIEKIGTSRARSVQIAEDIAELE